jgi:hypothetical protein
MRGRLLLATGLVGVILLQTQSCRPITPNAKTKGTQSEICDLEKMRSASDDASKQSLECAYNSLKLAGALSSGGLAKDIYEITVGTTEVYQAVMDGSELIGDLATYIKTGGVDDGSGDPSAMEKIDQLKSVVNVKLMTYETKLPGPARTAMYKCLAGHYTVLKDFLGFFTLAEKLKDAEGFSVEDLKNMALAPLTFATGLTDLTSANINCMMWLEGKRKLSLQRTLKAIKKIQQPIQTVITVGTCGVAIGKGGYILAQNSMCLVEDLGNYFESRENLQKQRDNFVNGDTVPKDDVDTGVNVCMRKYGIWLQKQSFYSYVYRSSVCGDYCADSSKRGSYFNTKASEIFPNDSERGWCKGANTIAGTSEAVRSCAVMCCDQDNGCVLDAMKHAGFE